MLATLLLFYWQVIQNNLFFIIYLKYNHYNYYTSNNNLTVPSDMNQPLGQMKPLSFQNTRLLYAYVLETIRNKHTIFCSASSNKNIAGIQSARAVGVG